MLVVHMVSYAITKVCTYCSQFWYWSSPITLRGSYHVPEEWECINLQYQTLYHLQGDRVPGDDHCLTVAEASRPTVSYLL